VIYDLPPLQATIDQGDIVDNCPVSHIAGFQLEPLLREDMTSLSIRSNVCRVIVLTQTCDLANGKVTFATVARLHEAVDVVQKGLLTRAEVRGSVRAGRVYGWYFLPAAGEFELPEVIADFRQLHTVRLDLLTALSRNGRRICRLTTPYREHMAQHFAHTYARIGLPEPYETAPE
jgi:hypothetical protein